MRHIHSIRLHGVVATAVRSALRFAARRRAERRRDAWRPIVLFWRQKRKRAEGVRATRLALTAGAVRLAQFHLHFVIRENDHAQRHATHRSSPVEASHQTRHVMEHRRTIIQSRMYLAQQRPSLSTVHLLSRMYLAQQRSSLSTVHRLSPGHVQGNSVTKLQATVLYSYSAHRTIVPATPTRATARVQFPIRGSSRAVTTPTRATARVHFPIRGSSRAVNRPQSPNPQRTHLRVRREQSVGAQDQTLKPVQTYRIEPHLFRFRPAVMHHLTPPRSQESTAAQPYFQPQALLWRRAMQTAAEIAGNGQQWDFNALEGQSQGRSFPGKEAASGMPHLSGHAPTTPAIKIDPALMDRMADDVIRRLERRARIERARQGL